MTQWTMGRRAVLCAIAVALLAAGHTADAFTAPVAISLRAPSRRLVSDRRACPPRAAETRPKNQMGGRGCPSAHWEPCCVCCHATWWIAGPLVLESFIQRHGIVVRRHERDQGPSPRVTFPACVSPDESPQPVAHGRGDS